MNAQDQRKLVRAGFTIIRKESAFGRHRIKAKRNKKTEWCILHDNFESKAAMQRKVYELLRDDYTVQD